MSGRNAPKDSLLGGIPGSLCVLALRRRLGGTGGIGAGMEPLSADDPRMIGEFRLHARLGAGGMGQVYLGFSPAGRAVAIKVIHSQFAADPEFLRRFSQEVTAARAVGGMYTAPVVDSSVTDRSPWLATAYVPGPPLSAIIAKHGA